MMELIPLFSLTFILFTLLIFIRAALHKIFDFLEFQGFVADYRLLPEALVKPATGLLVISELGIVVLLLIDATRSAGLILAACVLAGYAIAMGINLHHGHTRIECGCGGTPQLLSRSLIWRNIGLMLIALLPLLALPGMMAGIEIAFAMIAAVVMLVFYLLFEQTNANLIAIYSKIS